MKKLLRILAKTAQIVLIMFLLVFWLVIVPYFGNIVMPWKRASAVKVALEWGGLDLLPEDADVITVETEGSMFTREFIIEFYCDSQHIEEWANRSGLNLLKPIKEKNKVRVYQLPGQKGSIGGWVYIDSNRGDVIIDMCWS